MLSEFDKPGCPHARQNRRGAWVLCGAKQDPETGRYMKCKHVPFDQCKWYQ